MSKNVFRFALSAMLFALMRWRRGAAADENPTDWITYLAVHFR